MRTRERCRVTTVLFAAALCVLGCSGESRGNNSLTEWPSKISTPSQHPGYGELVAGRDVTQECGLQGQRCGENLVNSVIDGTDEATPSPSAAPQARPSGLATSAGVGQACSAGSISCGQTSGAQIQTIAVSSDPLRQQVGQMLIMGFQGKRRGDAGVEQIADYLERRLIGGILIGRHNVQSRGQVRALVNYLRARAGSYKPIFAVDQEGGLVQRLNGKANYTPVPRAANVAKQGPESAAQIYQIMAAELAETGINMNLGPVVDLNINPRNPIIAKYGRSYGRDAAEVTEFAQIFIDAHDRQNIATVAKHFPGHGSSKKDTHVAFADVTNTFDPSELEPYRVIGNNIDAVMTAHVAHAGITGDARLPASLSRDAIEGTLRGKIGYNNVVITDDMEMAAVRNKYGLPRAAIMAVNAGNDLLIFSNTWKHNPTRADVLIDILADAVRNQTISRQRVADAGRRIERLRSQVR